MSLLAGQVHYLSATTPLKIGKPPWCCPRQAEFWRLCCTSWCAAYWNSGCAESEERMCILRNWCGCRESHPDVLPGKKAFSLLNHSRMESKRAGSVLFHTPGPRHFNKEQTPLAIWFQIPTHGFTVVLSVFRGTPPAKPLDCKIRLKSSGAHL